MKLIVMVIGSVCMSGLLSWVLLTYLLFGLSLMMILMLWESVDVIMLWKLGGDLVSVMLVILSLWIGGLMFMSSLKEEQSVSSGEYKFLMLMIIFCLIMSFMSLDFFYFYIYFELVLIPMFIFIMAFGYQPERLTSGVYMMFYTVFGSLPLLAGFLWMGGVLGSFNYVYLTLWKEVNLGIWSLMLIMAFMIKLPVYGGHIWLPKAHVEAPVTGSMILAGLLLKLGGYGLFRVGPYLRMSSFGQSFWSVSGIWGGLLSGLVCLRQLDAKKFVAYSSVVHMGLFLSGMMSFKIGGFCGGLIMMIGHGLCSSGLFFTVNVLYERFYSRSIMLLKGSMVMMPSLMMWFFFLNLGNMAAPPFLNIFGEILLGSGIIEWSSWMSWLLLFMFFVGVLYSIFFFSFMSHGKSLLKGGKSVSIMEFMIMVLHFCPLGLLVLKLELFLWI